MQEIKELFQTNWKPFISYLNNLLTEGNVIFIPWKDMISDLKTQEKTKILSPIFTRHFISFFEKHGFVLCEENMKDIKWGGEDFEMKITLSLGNSWTGNGFKKVNWHLLIKLNLDHDGLIEKSFCCLVPLDECFSHWTIPSKTNNFSTLKLRTIDFEKIVVLHGEIEKKNVIINPILI